MAIGTLFGSNPESSGLYGIATGTGNNPTVISQTYFEWFIFTTSAGTPATPTGGSWDFNTNTGTAPVGWTNAVTGVPLNSLWFSIAFVDSRNPTVIVWSTPGLISSQSVYATAYADVFTGNGSTVAWTLSNDPVVVNNTDVSINGVTQRPTTDYTISGTTLTTTTAAPLNAIILVKYRQALPLSYYGAASNVQFTPVGALTATNVQAAIAEVVTDLALSSGSSTVGFLQAGTGAVATTVQAKLRETVSVKDFGAVGNGVADDFLAINRAVAYILSIGGGTIYYPAGTYRITRSIRLDNFNVVTNTYNGQVLENVVHAGAGRDATTILADGFYACIFSSFPEPFIPSGSVSPSPVPGNLMASNVVIQDMTLDCNYDNVVDGGAAYGANYQTSPPAVSGWPNGYVGPSYWAADNYQYPIYFYYAEGLQVTNCRVKNSWYNGIEIYASARVQINDNFVENCGDKANYLGYYAGVQFDQRSNTISCSDNIIQNCGNGVVSVSGAGATSAVSDVVVADNVFFNIGPGNGVYATDFVQRWSVTGNVFDTLENQGIVFANNQPVWPATDLPKDILIANNTIKEFNLANNVGTAGIRALGHNFVISGNEITQTNNGVTANTFGIVVSDSGVTVGTNERKGMTIVGNRLAGNFPGANQSTNVINVSAANTHISANTIISTGSSAQAAIGIDADDVNISSNAIQGTWQYLSGNRGIHRISGLRPYVQDNRYGPLTAIHTTTASAPISGNNNVDFSGLTTVVDVDARANYDSATDSITPDLPGVYELTAVLRVTAASASTVQGVIELNNATSVAVGVQSVGAGDVATISLVGFVTLNGTDIIRLRCNVSSGNYVIETFTSMSAKFVRQTT